MRRISTCSVNLPCPSCDVPQRLVASVALDDGVTEHPSSISASVSECEACWRRRAFVIGDERARLRASGVLGELASGVPTWMGAVVREGSDPVDAAMESEMLRQGVRTRGRAPVRLRTRVRHGQLELVPRAS